MAPNESKAEKLDRELEELLQGLRVLLPGVQVLFAFLLTVPFSQRFKEVSASEKGLFLSALLCAAIASALLIAPGALHRVLFREREKEWIVVRANQLAIIGTAFLAAAMTLAVFLVSEVLYGWAVAGGVAGGLGLVLIALWYVLPTVRRARQ